MAISVDKQREETSVVAAVVDVLDAGQRVLLDRIELLSVEARAAGTNVLASLAFMLCGLGLLLVGWVATNALAIVLLARIWDHAMAIGIVAAVNLLAGAIALLIAKRRGKEVLPSHAGDAQPAPATNGGSAG